MKIETLRAPREPAKMQEAFGRVLKAVNAVGLLVEAEGLAAAWLQDNAQLCLALEDDGAVAGIGLLVYGRRWYDAELTASVVFAHGPGRAALLEHFVSLSRVLGVEYLLYDQQEGDTIGGEPAAMRVLKIE